MMKMKILKILSISAAFALVATTVSCGDDDPKTPETQDLESPEVEITAPANGSTVKSLEATVSVTIEYEASDDVELASVAIDFDGTQIEEVTTFTDFRNLVGETVQDNVADGEHTVTVTVTDKAGKTATATSTFTKVTTEPYTPLDGEIFYMSFEGNYLESVTETEATVVGSPDFAGEGLESDDAYAGATDGYLTFDADDFEFSNELTVSMWMKVNNTPDRAGILVMGPVDPNNTEFQNNRNNGFRFFREAAGDKQIFKLNFGVGNDNNDATGDDVWLDGGVFAQIVPNTDEWIHFAFIIGETTATVYVDGAKAAENLEHRGLDITGCDLLSIMSGVPRFTEWSHFSDLSYLDELHIFNKALTEAELSTVAGIEIGEPVWNPDPGLDPIDGPDATEVLYMSFDTDLSVSVSSATATAVGSPTVVDGGVSGKAYQGAADSYFTLPAAGLLTDEFSVSMWIKVNATPDRAGILIIGPEDTGHAEYPDKQNKRTSGIRLFREAGGADQRFKLNVGNGTADAWADGGEYADIPADVTEWRHLAFTVSSTHAQVYLNGILVTKTELTSETVTDGLDWTGCDLISFGSGAPRFTEWGHLSDESMFDELRIYNGVLNPAQIAALKAVGD